jgi:hypothetical protein
MPAAPPVPTTKATFRLSPRFELVLFAVVTAALAQVYALATDHVWEDYFITFRHSRNLAEGKGLVYVSGEHVHGFTSPLGTLLPALLYRLAGSPSYVPSLWLFRFLSMAALAGGGLCVLRAFQQEDGKRNVAARFFFALFYACAIHLVVFATNGMETGFMLLFVGWGLYLTSCGNAARWPAMGLCWAGLLWTRPDGCVYIAAFALFAFLDKQTPRRATLAALGKATAVCTVLYLPWFAWAWWYYGSPVPHTVLAKSDVTNGPWARLLVVVGDLFHLFFANTFRAFAPIYPELGFAGWHRGTQAIATCLGVFAALYVFVPTQDRLGRLASGCFGFLCLYLSYLGFVYPWYLGPVTLFGLVAVTRGIPALTSAFRGEYPRWPILALALLGLVAWDRVSLFVETTRQMRAQQREIEINHRRALGLWLKANGKPSDTVFLEPAGYVGYFSEMRIADHMGLVSPDVVRLRRQGVVGFGEMIDALRPEWVVFRPDETRFVDPKSGFKDDYYLVRVFDASKALDRVSVPGKTYLTHDAVYWVFRRKDHR